MGHIKWHGANAGKPTGRPLPTHIGARLQFARQVNQTTMRHVAMGTGLSNTIICQIENGMSNPTAATIWKLSQFFGVSPAWWFEGYADQETALDTDSDLG